MMMMIEVVMRKKSLVPVGPCSGRRSARAVRCALVSERKVLLLLREREARAGRERASGDERGVGREGESKKGEGGRERQRGTEE